MILAYIKRKYRAFLAYCHWYKRLRSRNQTAFVIGTPTHNNIGDSAIALAEIQFLKQNGYKAVEEITLQEYISYRKCIRRVLPHNADIFLLGGGFMGSLWPAEEIWRQKMVEDFSQHRIVVFPQTIYYENNSDAEELMSESIKIYNSIPKLTLVAREKTSYDLMKRLYAKCHVLLTPDIVLSSKPKIYTQRRSIILTCFRHDKERKVSLKVEQSLITILRKEGYTVEETDMMSEEQVTANNRAEIVDNKMKQFAEAKLVLTDRLHGMVFSAVTGTPCIVFGNNHHKVEGTYEWIKSLDYIRYVTDAKEVIELVPYLYQKEKCVFDLGGEAFSDLQNLIRIMSKR